MKKILLFILAIVGIISGFAEEYQVTPTAYTSGSSGTSGTFSYSSTPVLPSGCVFTASKENGSTSPTYNASGKDVRVYANGTFTITVPTGYTLSNAVFNISSQGKKRLSPITVSTGEIASQSAGANVVWSGNVSGGSVTFTVGDKAEYGSDGSSKAGQFCFDGLTLTITQSDSPCPTKPADVDITVTSITKYEASVELTCLTPGATIYYGFDESTIHTEYTGIFTVSNPGTVYAQAELGAEVSEVTHKDLGIVSKPTVTEGVGGTEEIDFSVLGSSNLPFTSFKGDYITVTADKNGGTATAYNGTDKAVRVYKSNILSISAPEGYVITKIVSEAPKAANVFLGSVNEGTYSNNGTVTTWVGQSSEVKFTNILSSGTNSQWHISSLLVTYYKLPDAVTISSKMVGEQAEVTLACATEDAEIYYSLSGEEGSYQLYSAPFSLSETAAVYAYSQKTYDGNVLKSDIVSQEVKVSTKPEPVKIEYVTGDHKAMVTLTCETAGADIYYGFSDAEDAVYTKYEAPFEVTEAGTLYAYSMLNGNKSDVTSEEIVTIIVPAEVTIDAKTGRFSSTVTLACETEGASIKYGFAADKIDTAYTEPFTVTESCTVFAISELYGEKSEVKSEAIVISNDGNVTIVFKDENLSNAQDVSNFDNIEDSDIKISFAKGTNTSNSPKYYDSGTAVRVYQNNTVTVEVPEGFEIVNIAMEGATISLTSEPAGISGSGNSASWQGTPTNKVVFTKSGSGNSQIKSMTLEYQPVDPNRPEMVVVTQSLVDGYPQLTMTCETEGAVIKWGYSADKMTNVYSAPVIIKKSGKVYAIAENNGSVSHSVTVVDVEVPVHYATLKDAVKNGVDGEDVYVVGNMSVLYQMGDYLLLTDGASNALIYKDADTFAPGTHIDMIHAEISHYNGLFEFTNATLREGGEGAEYTPVEVTDLSSLTVADNLFDEVVIKVCDITGISGQKGLITLGDHSIVLYNTFNLENVVNQDNCTVTGFVWVNGSTIEIVPLKIEEGEKIPTIATPVFYPDGGALTDGEEIAITCETEGVDIYYTTDGTVPTQSSTKYTEPIVFHQAMVVKAIAYSADPAVKMTPSEVAEAEFIVYDPTARLNTLFDFTSEEDLKAMFGNDIPLSSTSKIYDISSPFTKPGSDVVISITKGTAGPSIYNYNDSYQLRAYKTGTITISGPLTEYYISSIAINRASSSGGTLAIADNQSGTYSNNVWTSDSEIESHQVVFNVTDNARIESIEVKLAPCKEAVAQPYFHPASSELYVGDKIEILCETEDAVIYYTLDGSEELGEPADPTRESILYTEPIEFTKDCRIKARAFSKETGAMLPSEVVEATYTLNPRSADISHYMDFKHICAMVNGGSFPKGQVYPTTVGECAPINGTVTDDSFGISVAPAAELYCASETANTIPETETPFHKGGHHNYSYQMSVKEGAVISMSVESFVNVKQISFDVADGATLSLVSAPGGTFANNVWTADGYQNVNSNGKVLRAPEENVLQVRADSDLKLNGFSARIDVPTAVDGIGVDEASEPAYYTLQGVRVKNPVPGIYIVVRGQKVTKELVK